jgi:flavin reductase (DIM6/NTAB) family NADH-FMN oxidoreductase RutF
MRSGLISGRDVLWMVASASAVFNTHHPYAKGKHMQKVDYLAIADDIIGKIRTGALLTVRAGERLNTMTIGWASIGFCWRKPVFMVAVRDSRYTFTLIEDAADFTVSVPTGDMQAAITYCGTRSGRDGDKFAACGLATVPGQAVASPVIAMPGIHFECRIVYKAAMDPAHLADELASLYPEKDFHTLYFGEIMACYQT